MKYDSSKIMYDQPSLIDATNFFNQVKLIISTTNLTSEILAKIKVINPNSTTILNTINLALGWIILAKENDQERIVFRGVIDILAQYIAGVE